MDIKKLTIVDLKRYSQDTNGNPLRTKDGRDYERVMIQTNEYGSSPLSGFGGPWNSKWKKGDVVNVKVEEKAVGGKKYLNFSRIDELEMRIIELEEKVEFLLTGKKTVEEQTEKLIENEIKAEDMPF